MLYTMDIAHNLLCLVIFLFFIFFKYVYCHFSCTGQVGNKTLHTNHAAVRTCLVMLMIKSHGKGYIFSWKSHGNLLSEFCGNPEACFGVE